MFIPSLSVRIQKNSLAEVYQVLQGISRYISAIYLNQKLVDREGLAVLDRLVHRYPNKRVFFEVNYSETIITDLQRLLKETAINNYAIIFNTDLVKLTTLTQIQRLLTSAQKRFVVFINSTNFKTRLGYLNSLKITEIVYYKTLNDLVPIAWTQADYDCWHSLVALKTSLKIANITCKNLGQLSSSQITPAEFIAGSEVTFSFNPIESCKKIYLEIKTLYT